MKMKILHLKGCKWLLPQNQRVRINFLGYIGYEALAKHIKRFVKKTLKWKDVSAPTISNFLLFKTLVWSSIKLHVSQK